MTSVYKQALQSVKAFRTAEVLHGAGPRSRGSLPAGPGMPRANPFLVTRITRHTPATRAASRQLRAAKGSKTNSKEVEALKKKLPALPSTTRAPKISLRRQADLVKKARMSGTLELLPPGPKTAAILLREQRVRAGLTPALLSLLDASRAPPNPASELSQLTESLKSLTLANARPLAEARRGVAELRSRARKMEEEIAEFEVVQLLDALPGSAALRGYERKKEVLGQLKEEIGRASEGVAKMLRPAAVLQARIQKVEGSTSPEGITPRKMKGSIPGKGRGLKKAKAPAVPIWQRPIKWVGQASAAKKTPGSEIGLRLYAGKTRMFKGHLWERRREGRIRKRAVLMRDMAARVTAYKQYYKKRKPNPLKPSRYTKPPKLPY